LYEGNTSKADAQVFNIISRMHPWLANLSQAQATPLSLKNFMMGSGLGMFFIEMTAKCNEKCVHCYADSHPERTEILSIEEIKKALDNAAELGNPLVQFTGGDPFIHPDLLEAVQHASQLNFRGVEIYTNGLLLSAERLAQFLPYRPRFAFSVYSHDPKTHDEITQVPGSFERTMRGIKRAVDSGLVVRANAVIMKQNQGHERPLQHYLHEEIGIPWNMIGFDTMNDMGRGEFMDYVLDLDEQPAKTHKPADFDDLPSSPSQNSSHVTPEIATQSNNEKPQMVAKMPNITSRTGKLCVSYSGDVFPCIFARQNWLGNIRDNTLPEMMDKLDQREAAKASVERWTSCKESLTCGDCQIINYQLGNRIA
ncbi:MAG: radical SAM/SPASM domain-containing protein, partial [Mariprofundaceae bacterium]|nr:radical SAM/SPASM domain-containing protein [Mariprofundaceae bacterium]